MGDRSPKPSGSITEAESWLLANHPAFKDIASKHGPCKLDSRTQGMDHFQGLARAIIFQQLAGKAAATIHSRFTVALGGTVSPEGVIAAGYEVLRSAGLSNAKALSVQDLASKVLSGELHLERLASSDEDRIVESLTKVRGIGNWTAQMYLMFTLGRLDVWPSGDLGVQKGYTALYGLRDLIGHKALQIEGDRFRPYRSVAAWYLWRVAEDMAAKQRAV